MSPHVASASISALLVPVLASVVSAQSPVPGPLQWLPGDALPAPLYGNEQAPALCAGGAGYLLVWNDARSTPLGSSTYLQSDVDLYGQLLDGSGAPLGAAFPVATSFGYQKTPRVAWNGENWLVAWTDQAQTQFYYQDAVKAVRVSPQGVLLDAAPLELFAASSEVQLAANGSTWLAVGQSYDSQTNMGLVGRRVAADGALLDAAPVVLVPATYYLYFSVGVAAAHGEYLLTWSEINAQKAGRFDDALAPLGASFGLPGSKLASNGSDWFLAWNDDTLRASPLTATGALLVPGGAVVASGFDAYQWELDAAWDGANWIVAWLHTYDAVRLARVTPAGAVLDLGGVVQDASDDDYVYGLDVAGDPAGSGTQVVWGDIRAGYSFINGYDVRGRHVSTALAPGAESVLSTAVPAQMRVELAEYPGGGLAVFESRTSFGTRILGQRLSADGAPLDAEPFEVAAGAVSSPTAVWDGQRFLVAWTDADGIRARRLGANGSFLDGASILAVPAGFSPDVAALNGTFLVAGLKFGFNIQYIDPIAARIDGATGAVLGAPVVLGWSYAGVPRVIALDDRWLVTWQRNYSHDDPQGETDACFVAADGAPSPFFTVAYNAFQPDLAFSGAEVLFVYRTNSVANANNDVGYRRMLPGGTFPASGAVLSAAAGRQVWPVVAWDGTQFVAAWEDQRNQLAFYDGRTDVYAARVSVAGALLDPAAFPVEIGTVPQARPAVAAATGTPGAALLASSSVRTEPGFHAWRLGVRTLGPAPLWSDLGQALAGASGAPFLAGAGALVAGSPLQLAVTGAAPLAPAVLVVGLSVLDAPFKGGVLVPAPDAVVAGLLTSPTGELLLAGTWPGGVPSGTALVFQQWIQDAAGPQGWSASNALEAFAP